MNPAVGIRDNETRTSLTSTGCHNEGVRACLLDMVRLQHKGSVRDAISADLRACRLMPRAMRAHMEERAVHGSYRHFGMNSSSPDLRVYPRYPKLAVITRKPLEAITRPKGLEATRGVRRVYLRASHICARSQMAPYTGLVVPSKVAGCTFWCLWL